MWWIAYIFQVFHSLNKTYCRYFVQLIVLYHNDSVRPYHQEDFHSMPYINCKQSSVLTSTPAAVCQCQRFILAARPLQLTAGLIAPPVRAAHRLPLRPWADDPTVTVSVSNQPLQSEIQQHVGIAMVYYMRNVARFRFHITQQINLKITELIAFFSHSLKTGLFFLFGSFSFFLVSLCLNKGCIQLNLRLCQTNVQIGLMGHLFASLKTFLCSSNTCRPLPFFV